MIERCVDTSYACYSDKEQRLSWSTQVAVQDHDDEMHWHNNNILHMTDDNHKVIYKLFKLVCDDIGSQQEYIMVTVIATCMPIGQ